MITKNLSTLKIHKLTKEQYERERESGNLDEHAIYLTPDEDMDLSNYATKAELTGKANKEHSHAIADVADLQTTLEGKTPYGHKHSAADLTSGTLNADRLPIVPISKGGTGAETATGLLNNLGIATSANELNYVKGVTSGIQSQLDNKSPSTHTHDYAGSASPGGSATRAIGDKDGNEITATYETKEQSTKNLQAAKKYADDAAVAVRTSILGGAEGAYDTLKELKELIDAGDSSAVEALQEVAANKADRVHTHTIANVNGLQDALDDKQDTITGAAATITRNNLTASRVLVSNISGKVAASSITDVELGYLDNATSNIQSQINSKFDKAGGNINGRVGVSGSVELNNGENYIHLVISRMKGGKTHSAGMLPSSDDGSTIILHQTDGTIDNQLTLSPTATYLKQPLSVDSGGTGANNAASARANLGITPANIGAAPSSHTHTIAQVTSLQDSLNAKQNVVNGGASTITSSNLTANRALISNTDGKVTVSAVTSTELGYLDGVTANVQTQLDGKIKIGSFGNSNINALYDMGIYSIQGGSNCPSGAQYGMVLTMPYRKAYGNTKSDYAAQIFLPDGDDTAVPNDMFFRTSIANTWNSWNKVLHSNNYSSYALPRSAGSSYPLLGGLYFKTNSWTGNIIADNASGQRRYEMFSGSSTGTPAQFYIRVFNNEAGTTYVDYTFGTDGTLAATKFKGNLEGNASSATNASKCNGVISEWSGSVAWNDTAWIAAWTNDGTKIKCLNKNNFASADHTHAYLPLACDSSTPLTGALYFQTNSWAGDIVGRNASGKKRWELFSNSNAGAVADCILHVHNNAEGTTMAQYRFGTDGTLTATKFSGSLSGDASSAHILNINNVEAKSVGRLQFFQTYNNSTLLPDTDWWSLIRTQHAGYTNGYWQEMAYSFSSDVIKFRRNVNGTKTAWRTIAFTDSNISGNAATATNATNATNATYSSYLNLVAGNEIRIHNATGQTTGGDIWLGWAWASGDKTVKKSWIFGNFSGGGLADVTAGAFLSNTWASKDYGGGWYMTDNTWIRSYGGKNIYQDSGIMRTDGTLQVGSGGAYFNSSSSGTNIGGKLVVTYSGVGGLTIHGSGTTTGIQITRTDSNYGIRVGMASSGAQGIWACDYNKSDTTSMIYMKPTDTNATTYIPNRIVMSGSYGTGNPPTTGTLVNGMIYYKIIS